MKRNNTYYRKYELYDQDGCLLSTTKIRVQYDKNNRVLSYNTKSTKGSFMKYVKEYEPSPESNKTIQMKHILDTCAGLYSLFNTINALVETKTYKTMDEYLNELFKSKEDLLSVKYITSLNIRSDLEETLKILFKNKEDYEKFMEFYKLLIRTGYITDGFTRPTIIAYGSIVEYISKLLYSNKRININGSSRHWKSIYKFIEENDNIMVYEKLTRTENINIFNALKGYRICYDNNENMYESSKDLVQAVSVLYDFRFYIILELEDRNYLFDENIEDIEFRNFVIDCLKYRPHGEYCSGSILTKAAVIHKLITKIKVYTCVENLYKTLKRLG